MFFGASGSPEILTHTPEWEGRCGNGSCEGLVSVTGDRNEGPLGAHPIPESTTLQCGCPQGGVMVYRDLSAVWGLLRAPQPEVLTVTSKLCHRRQCPLPGHFPAGVRTQPMVLGAVTLHFTQRSPC